jgi:hypothetical protein
MTFADRYIFLSDSIANQIYSLITSLGPVSGTHGIDITLLYNYDSSVNNLFNININLINNILIFDVSVKPQIYNGMLDSAMMPFLSFNQIKMFNNYTMMGVIITLDPPVVVPVTVTSHVYIIIAAFPYL